MTRPVALTVACKTLRQPLWRRLRSHTSRFGKRDTFLQSFAPTENMGQHPARGDQRAGEGNRDI